MLVYCTITASQLEGEMLVSGVGELLLLLECLL